MSFTQGFQQGTQFRYTFTFFEMFPDKVDNLQALFGEFEID